VTSPALPYGLSGRDEARAYFDWVVRLFGPALAGDVLDHGAGTGAVTARLVEQGCHVVALEPDAGLLAGLRERFRGDARVEPLHGTIETYLAARGERSLDAVISSNVLEHLTDDLGCLRLLREGLRPGGALAVYVPARRELFGSLDASVGHLRRYSRTLLGERLEQAGFFVEWLRYGNLVGALPWLVAGRVLQRSDIKGQELAVFDRWIFPIASRLESLLRLPYGLNLAALARRQ
jgi:SAM-dependent methyltransferase